MKRGLLYLAACVLLFACCASLNASAGALGNSWERLAPADEPPRQDFATVFEALGQLWMFGVPQSSYDDYQAFSSADGVAWSLLTVNEAWRGGYYLNPCAYFGSKFWRIGHGSGDDYNSYSTNGIDWVSWPEVPPFGKREGMAYATHNDMLYLCGGRMGSSGLKNDVWRSSDGEQWTLLTDSAPWTARLAHSLTVHNGQFWLIGGSLKTGKDDGIWRSEDGAEWTLATASVPWQHCSEHTCVSFNGELWLIGGLQQVDVFGGVWHSPDGVNWSEAVTAEPRLARLHHNSFIFNGRLWIGGGRIRATQLHDFWSTTDGVHWELAPNTIAWSPREEAAGIVYRDAMWLIGGVASESPLTNVGTATGLKEIYRSADGINWTAVTRDAPWPARRGHGVVEHEGALWLMGGTDGVLQYNDVWKSSDGETWELISAAAPWSPRHFHRAAAFRGRIWLLGGIGAGNTVLGDVWSSADGENWTLETAAAPWGPRASMGLAAHRGRLWLVCGANISFGFPNSRDGVWYSEDGKQWTQAADAPLPRRSSFGLTSFAGRLWASGGFFRYEGRFPGTGPVFRKDVWSSHDGITWMQETSAAPWDARRGHASLAYKNKLWLLGGAYTDVPVYLNDVWVSGGDLGAHTADQNADYALDLSELLRVIQLYNSGAFHCDAATEDGYAPGAGDRNCAPHAGDYDGPDWQFSLSEVLRAVQFYNAFAGIMPCDTSEDGWCPVVY